MKEVLIDTSEGHVGIVIAESQIIRTFCSKLTKRFGRPVHMSQLSLGQKFAALRRFDDLFYGRDYSKREIELYSLQEGSSKWWVGLVQGLVQKRITTFNVDFEVLVIFKRCIDNMKLRALDIYTIEETLQLADIIAFGNSHRKLARNIWKNVPLKV
jgi:hypothetical protein